MYVIVTNSISIIRIFMYFMFSMYRLCTVRVSNYYLVIMVSIRCMYIQVWYYIEFERECCAPHVDKIEGVKYLYWSDTYSCINIRVNDDISSVYIFWAWVQVLMQQLILYNTIHIDDLLLDHDALMHHLLIVMMGTCLLVYGSSMVKQWMIIQLKCLLPVQLDKMLKIAIVN